MDISLKCTPYQAKETAENFNKNTMVETIKSQKFPTRAGKGT